MTTNKKSSVKSDEGAMPLAGEEAVELYAAEIARKIAALSEQADLLRAEIAESQQLLRDIE